MYLWLRERYIYLSRRIYICVQMKRAGKIILEECAHRHFSSTAKLRKQSLWSSFCFSYPAEFLFCPASVIFDTHMEQGYCSGPAPLAWSITDRFPSSWWVSCVQPHSAGHEDVRPQLGAFSKGAWAPGAAPGRCHWLREGLAQGDCIPFPLLPLLVWPSCLPPLLL